jgi:hypothetical protein
MFGTEFWVTVTILVAAVAIVGWMVWLEKHPRQSLSPRLVPTTFIIVVAGLVALMAFFHVVDVVKPVVGH